jgi:tetratricopeptide (TPR) repeat protein
MKMNAELKRASTKIHQRDIEGAMYEYDQCVNNHPNECSPRVHRGMVCFIFFFHIIFPFLYFKLKTLVESYPEAHDDFNEALKISPTNLRARYQKLINDAKIGAKENRPERVEQALGSFEEYYDTCRRDIYYALALTSVNLLNKLKIKTKNIYLVLFG